MRHRIPYILVGGAIFIAAVTGYYMWKHREPTPPQQGRGMPVETFIVAAQPLAEEFHAVGNLEASEAVVVRTEVPGKIAAIHFTEGQPVKKDELLLEIDDRMYVQEVERTRAAYDLSKLTLDRQTELSKSGATSEQLKDEAQAAMVQSKATKESAELMLERTKIKAPFDGIVALRKIAVGDYLNVADAVTNIVAVDPMKIEFSVPERYFSSLQEGLKLYVSVDAWPGLEFEGHVYAVNPEIDPETHNITAKALLKNQAIGEKEKVGGYLRPGMFGYIRLTLNTKPSVLLIPEEALIPKGDKMSVMKVVDNKVQTVEVTLGVRQKNMAEITSGLENHDMVITAGYMKVQEGMPVTSIPRAPGIQPPIAEPSAADKKDEEK